MAHFFRSADDARRAAEAATRRTQTSLERFRRLDRISRTLSFYLRHQELSQGEDGFMPLDDLLKLLPVTTDELCDVVEDWSRNNRGFLRFEVTERIDGIFWIRATGHHTIDTVNTRRIYADPQGIKCSRLESHKRACRKLRAADLVPGQCSTPDVNLCVICLSEAKTHAVIPCGHKCLCRQCAVEMQRRPSRCPLCKSEFDCIVQIFD